MKNLIYKSFLLAGFIASVLGFNSTTTNSQTGISSDDSSTSIDAQKNSPIMFEQLMKKSSGDIILWHTSHSSHSSHSSHVSSRF